MLSKKSLERLNTCHEDLIEIIMTVSFDTELTVIEGERSKEKQLRLYNEGKSRVTQGKHNHSPSLAVDIAPLPLDWEDLRSFHELALKVLKVADEKNINIRWGGDWDGDGDFRDQKFNDLVHFELRNV